MLRNMIFPVTTMLSLGVLFCFWGLPAAVVMHMNANAVSNAIFEPVKTLNYAAIPYRVLGQVRMLVEGVIYPAGIALSGIGLLWLQSMAEPRTMLLVTLCLAVLFAVVCGGVGAGFLPSLLRSLRQRAAAPAGQNGRMGMSRFSSADVLALENHSDPQVRRYAAELRDKLDAGRRTPPGMLLSCRCIRTLALGLEHPVGGSPSGGMRRAEPLRRRRHRRSGFPGAVHPGRRCSIAPSWPSGRSGRGAPRGPVNLWAVVPGRANLYGWPPAGSARP